MSLRRELSDKEKEYIEVIIGNTVIDNLYENYRDMYASIIKYYALDGRLSDRQIELLKKCKYFSDMKKRKYSYRTELENIQDKLDAVFNPV